MSQEEERDITRRSVLKTGAAMAGLTAAGGRASAESTASYWYDGRGSGASWRDTAQSRIESNRKANLDVTVVDSNGNAVDGATVDVEMQSHEFNFGTAVNAWALKNKGDAYKNHLQEDFNYTTIEAGLKAKNWETGAKDNVRWAIPWLNDHGFDVRGHAALWETWDMMHMDSDSDDYYQNMSASEINQTVKDKIRDRVSEFSGQVRDWDMQNHPKWRTNIRNYIADRTSRNQVSYPPEWWGVADDADPNANMGINEMDILQNYPDHISKNDYLAWWINHQQNNGNDVEGIGMMSHCNINRLTGIPKVLDILDRFGQFGIPIYISELHITLDNWPNKSWSEASQEEKDAQREYLRDFVTACFSHSAVETIVHWTFWEGLAWRQTSALYGEDWTRRDHGQMWRDLIYDQWWTDEQGWTDSSGNHTTNGFKGNYKVTASKDGESAATWVWLDDGGASTQLTLDLGTNFDPNKEYKIESVHSGKVLDVADRSEQDGGNIQQWTDYGNANQRWYIREVGNDKYEIEAAHSGKVLDVEGWSDQDGGNVQQWGDNDTANQRWYITDGDGNGEYKIESVHSGKVLDVADWSEQDGGNIQQWTDHGNANQRWRIE
ncbi:hypothetical protein BRC95_06905 [Halobacteriales archaeon QS_5_68_33]|nr:MAG: hypothetical protein BRC95_06905 [Halobacteriales archaeon QS_5_68_33]